MNDPNKGYCWDLKHFNAPYVNGKSVITEEYDQFTAKELEVFVVSQA